MQQTGNMLQTWSKKLGGENFGGAILLLFEHQYASPSFIEANLEIDFNVFLINLSQTVLNAAYD